MAGNVTYFEIPSGDIEATQRFWGSLFGWSFREGNFPGYSMIDGPTPMGGAPHEDAGRHPRIFFAVPDIHAAISECVAWRYRGRASDDPLGSVRPLRRRPGRGVQPLPGAWRTGLSQPTTQADSGRPRWSKALLPLAVATFAVGTDAFVIAGLLPSIASDLGVSVAAAAQLVTVFALTLAIGAPVLSWLLSSLDRGLALQLALGVFIVGNIATALSPNYPLMMAARVLTAVGAATITASASSAAVAIAPEARRGRAMAVVIGGLTLSTALGMPVGNLIGSVDWRMTLWFVAGLGVLAACGIAAWLPKVSLPAVGLLARLAPRDVANRSRVMVQPGDSSKS